MPNDISNNTSEENEYPGITSSSNINDKLEAVFAMLLKQNAPVYINYKKLFIENDDEQMFNGLVERTGLVERHKVDLEFNPRYKLSTDGINNLNKFKGSFLSWEAHRLNVRHELGEKNAKNEMIELRNLRLEHLLNEQELKEFKEHSARSLRAEIVSFIALGVAIISLLFKCS
jgi:hypothetical protein